VRHASSDELDLGPDVLQHLLPHRRPFLMVDRVKAYGHAPEPYLRAERYISANEPVFDGHFPGWHVWPGVLTLEGLGQCCNILCVLQAIEERLGSGTTDAPSVSELLANLERGYRLDPGFRPALLDHLPDGAARASERVGLAAAADIKWLSPVFPGDRLEFHVVETHHVGDMLRHRVQASVAGRPVTSGTITSKVGVAMPRRPEVA